MSEIIEINNRQFSDFITKVMPFLNKNPVSEAICIHVEAAKNGFPIKYINSKIDWEDFDSTQASLEALYLELFKDHKFDGDVLFFYPFCKTKNGNPAIIISSDSLKEFLIKKHIEVYPEYFNVEMYSFGFYFFNENIFYGMEHPDFLYYFKIK